MLCSGYFLGFQAVVLNYSIENISRGLQAMILNEFAHGHDGDPFDLSECSVEYLFGFEAIILYEYFALNISRIFEIFQSQDWLR